MDLCYEALNGSCGKYARPAVGTLVISYVLLMISVSWLIPAIFAYTSTYLELNLHGDRDFYETHVRCVGGCHVFFTHGPAVVTSLVSFYIPGLIIIGIYSRIYMVARNQARSINLQLNQLRRVYPSEGAQCRAQKATITIAIVVGVFLWVIMGKQADVMPYLMGY
ncbi:hypothetical protein QQF64_016313 [Cirrhinus molitorella]|uniref:G-protein coupled receptors family 1 profile domain-containing protein n=1 Tax=Cirrhinus molitorella TaxID=172907 RepID=A0ABR3LQX8_9TELE